MSFAKTFLSFQEKVKNEEKIKSNQTLATSKIDTSKKQLEIENTKLSSILSDQESINESFDEINKKLKLMLNNQETTISAEQVKKGIIAEIAKPKKPKKPITPRKPINHEFSNHQA